MTLAAAAVKCSAKSVQLTAAGIQLGGVVESRNPKLHFLTLGEFLRNALSAVCEQHHLLAR